jgi:hypothetical protein
MEDFEESLYYCGQAKAMKNFHSTSFKVETRFTGYFILVQTEGGVESAVKNTPFTSETFFIALSISNQNHSDSIS